MINSSWNCNSGEDGLEEWLEVEVHIWDIAAHSRDIAVTRETRAVGTEGGGRGEKGSQ